MAKSGAKKNLSGKRIVSGKRGKTASGSYANDSLSNHKEIFGIVLLGIGILSFASIIIPSGGALITSIKSIIQGIGGQLCLLLPLLLCGLGIFVFFGGENTFLSRKTVICSFIIFLLVETFLQSFQALENGNWIGYILESYKYSANAIKGGGLVGSVFAWPLIKLLDTWGCQFVSVVGIVIALMAATGITFGPIGNKLSEILDDIRVKASQRWDDFQADREDRAREKMEERQRKLAEEEEADDSDEEYDAPEEESRHSKIISKTDLKEESEVLPPRKEESYSYVRGHKDFENEYTADTFRNYEGKREAPSSAYRPESVLQETRSVPRLKVVRNNISDTDLYIASADEFESPQGNTDKMSRSGFTEEQAIRAFKGVSDEKTVSPRQVSQTDSADPSESEMKNEPEKKASSESRITDLRSTAAAESVSPENSSTVQKDEQADVKTEIPIQSGSFGTNLQLDTQRHFSRRRVTPAPVQPSEDPSEELPKDDAVKSADSSAELPENQTEITVDPAEIPSVPDEAAEPDIIDDGNDAVSEAEEESISLPVPLMKAVSSETEENQDVIPECQPRRLDSTPIVMPKKETHEQVQTEDYSYAYPPIDLLDPSKTQYDPEQEQHDNATGDRLMETLNDFGVKAKLVNHTHGPAITRFEIQPDKGVKVSRITTLADDIALNLASDGVRIEAPVPGKPVVGIEVPNRHIETVCLRDVLESEQMTKEKSPTAVALGKGISGAPVIADMAKMPHVLIAGATGSGKSVCINTIIQSIIFRATPQEVKLILIDPKVVELSVYNGIPHLLIPVVTDPKKASAALSWAVVEMEQRYKRFETMGVRDIKGYNAAISEGEAPMPKIIVIIDELADLMMVAPGEVEDSICRLAQLARAAGIHLVIATQRPSVNVITGVIKANIPSRIAFAVSSQIDSRTILDAGGAEKLLGKGDMLYAPQGVNKPTRVQGCFVTDDEVQRVVSFAKSNHESDYNQDVIEQLNSAGEEEKKGNEDEAAPAGEFADEMFIKAVDLAVDAGQVSISMLQRRLRVGYARAGRLVDEMTEKGYTAEAEGPTKPRKVLITRDEWNQKKQNMQ